MTQAPMGKKNRNIIVDSRVRTNRAIATPFRARLHPRLTFPMPLPGTTVHRVIVASFAEWKQRSRRHARGTVRTGHGGPRNDVLSVVALALLVPRAQAVR